MNEWMENLRNLFGIHRGHKSVPENNTPAKSVLSTNESCACLDSIHDSPASFAKESDYTGERHIRGLSGQACGDLIHMLRYAYAAPLVRGRTVLDIACGSGYGSQFLAAQGAVSVVGVDNATEAIEYARTHHASPTIRYVEGDAHALPTMADATFDMIVSFETFEHLESPMDFLVELRRLLKPGGTLLLSCPNDRAIPIWQSKFHRRPFRFDEFRDMVLRVFEQARFLGQHHLLGSCLTEETKDPEPTHPDEDFRRPLTVGHFAREYATALPALDDADGYLAIIGANETELGRVIGYSHRAFRELLGGFSFLQSEAAREKGLADEERKKRLALQAELSRLRTDLAEERATMLSRLNRVIAKVLGRR